MIMIMIVPFFRRIPLEYRWALGLAAVLVGALAWLLAPIFFAGEFASPPATASHIASALRTTTVTVAGIVPQESLLMSTQPSALQAQWHRLHEPPIYYTAYNSGQ